MTTGRRRAAIRMVCPVMLMLLAACSSAPSLPGSALPSSPSAKPPDSGVLGTLGDIGSKTLEVIGLKKPALPEVPAMPEASMPDWPVRWKIYASDSLNVLPDGTPLAVAARVYKLRSADAFLRAPREVFGDPAREKDALGEDLVAVRDIQLVPGQRHESLDKVPREARHVGIVALFRNPADGRWRYAFGTGSAALSGLHLGVHACAMSVQVGEPVGMPLSAARQTALPCP